MAEKPVSIPGTIKWQPGRIVDGIRGGAVYLYAINRYGAECCLGKWGSPDDAKGTPYEREVAEVFAAEEMAAGSCVECRGTGRSCGNKHCPWPWCAPCKACSGTGRKTEESDVPNAVLQSGDVGRAEPSSEAAAVETADARVAVPSERPIGVPSHVADTDWTVIEGRAVWREGDALCVADGLPSQAPWRLGSNVTHGNDVFRADVPQSLFLAARRWMGWEKLALPLPDAAAFQHPAKPKPTLTPVDLTELREAWKEPGERTSENWDRFIAAIEKLLSSGGAP